MGGGYFRLKTIRKILPIFLFLIALISVIYFKSSQAKYSVGHIYEDIVTGNVVNSTGDLIIEKIYIDDTEVEEIPEGNYEIDNRSECTVHGDKQDIEFSYENGKLGIFGVVKRNTKCTIYLNTIKDPLDAIIAQAKTDKPDLSKSSCLNGTNDSSHSGGKYSNCGEETNGLYKETTKLGTTYYYRGTINNNWVKYGTNENQEPIWWRIIRINEDRTVRLIYAGEGEQAPASADQVGGQGGYWLNDSYGINNSRYIFNEGIEENAYVGYMYGMPGSDSFEKEHGYDLIDSGAVDQLQSSDIKKTIDDWYINNLADEGNVLSGSTGFCGDRAISDYDLDTPSAGYGKEMQSTYYKFYDRLNNNMPSFECPNVAYDLYTTKSDKGNGNGALTYPIGLITADEVIFAGYSAAGAWLSSKDTWTITPSFSFDAAMYSSDLAEASVYMDSGIRPVVNVLPDYFDTEGKTGTIENPYIVELTKLK